MIADTQAVRPTAWTRGRCSILALSFVVFLPVLRAFASSAGANPAPKAATAKAVTSRERSDGLARLRGAVAKAQRLVEKVRGVTFKAEVASDLLPESELPGFLAGKLIEDLPVPFERYATALSAIGLIEQAAIPDLLERITTLYSRQVVGFYDPAERKFSIVPERASAALVDDELQSEGGEGTAALMEEALLAHELTHALQDQRLGLDARMKSLKDSSDGLLALQAFLEGEATVVMTEALVSRLPVAARDSDGTLASMLKGLSESSEAIEGAEGVPTFFVKELLFPYAAGTEWIQRKRAARDGKSGRWKAIDIAYARLPETSSEILHPERARAPRKRLPKRVAPSETLSRSERSLFPDTLGEWTLRTLLEIGGVPVDAAASLAAEWHDDRALFFEAKGAEGKDPVGFTWQIRCATLEGARRLADALTGIYRDREPGSEPVAIDVQGDVIALRRGLPKPRPVDVAGRCSLDQPWPLAFRTSGITTKS